MRTRCAHTRADRKQTRRAAPQNASNMTENSIFKYLCPTLIPENDMREELRRRYFNVKGLDRKNKDELTQLFIRHLMPLPQRNFPYNYQGKLINRMIHKENLQSKRNLKAEEKKSIVQYGFSGSDEKSSSSLFGKSGHSSIHHDRLKPPIDSSGIQTKRISLVSSSSSSTQDKVIIKDRSKQHQVSNDSDCARQNNFQEVGIKKPELKRTHSSERPEDDESSPKKSRQRIAWP